MSAQRDQITYKTIHYADGWVEIRETENADAWIACDRPRPIED